MSEREDELKRRAELLRRRAELGGENLPPIVRAAQGAQATKEAFQELSDNPVKAGAQLVGGAFDVVGGGIAGLAERVEGLGRGLIGAVNPNATYAEARRRTPAPLRDPAPVSAGGRVVANALGTVIGSTRIPDVLNAVGGGIEAVAGPDAREAAGTVAELATLPLSRVKPLASTARPAASARAVEAVVNDGFVVPPYRPTGPGGQVAGTGGQNLRAGLATHSVNDAKLSIVNQDVSQRWATRSVNIDELSPEALEAARRQSLAAYEELRKTNLAVGVDRQLIDDVASLGGQTSGPGVKLPVDAAVERLQTAVLNTSRHSTGSIIDNVQIWRRDGFRGLASEDVKAQQLGRAQLAAADALDNLLDRNMQRAAAMAQNQAPGLAALWRRLHGDYVNARRRLADLHVLEDATNKAGELDPKIVHRIGQNRTLNPFQQKIADAYEVMPDAMQQVSKASRNARANSFTIAPNTIAGIGTMISKWLARSGAGVNAADPLTLFRRNNRRLAGQGLKYGTAGTARATALNSALGDEEQ